jgi:Uma2 family endonuclease
MAVNPRNNRLAFLIGGLIQYWTDAKDLGGEVYTDPTMMLLSRDTSRPIRKGSAREPDVMFFSTENPATMEDKFMNGPADIVVEIVSPDSRRRDRHTKYFEYEKAGVREYWIHDPDNNETEFFQLDETGKYRRIELENGTIYHSAVLPGFTLDTTWLAQRPLPKLMTIINTWSEEQA